MIPPFKAKAFVKPSSWSLLTAALLVPSEPHAQYATISASLATSFDQASSLSIGTCSEPLATSPVIAPRTSRMIIFVFDSSFAFTSSRRMSRGSAVATSAAGAPWAAIAGAGDAAGCWASAALAEVSMKPATSAARSVRRSFIPGTSFRWNPAVRALSIRRTEPTDWVSAGAASVPASRSCATACQIPSSAARSRRRRPALPASRRPRSAFPKRLPVRNS